eukprot:NODE_206_length_12919_cov_0.381357.p6 type:complete len:287 gc:universal NODE_206_length_12919_cov_0.381357:1437-577(-)
MAILKLLSYFYWIFDIICCYIELGCVCSIEPKTVISVQEYNVVLINALGHGYSSTVYKVHINFNIYALKMTKVVDAVTHYHAEKELQCLQLLKDIPYVINLIAFEASNTNYHLLFEYAPYTLHQMMPKLKNSSIVVSLMVEICRAVLSLHQLNVIHKDIKPMNIVFVRPDKLKLIDFGFSEMLISHELTSEWLEGTLEYMAPECFIGEFYKYGLARDVWSIGCIYYELIIGDLPWLCVDDDEMINKISSLKYVDCHGNKILENLLQPNKNKRITTMGALKMFNKKL